MGTLSDIVSVTITSDSSFPSRRGFGLPLILTYHTKFVERYRTYSSIAEMAADGFTSNMQAYRIAAAYFAQNPCVEQVVVGRMPSAPSFSHTLTITSAVEGQRIKCKVISPTDGTVNQVDYLIPAASTTTTVATAVEALIEAFAGVDSSTALAVITVTPTTPGVPVYIYDLQNCTLEETTTDANYGTELDALILENNDWYFLSIDSSSEANVDEVADWVQGQGSNNPKLFFVPTSSDAELAGTGTLASTHLADSNDRVVFLWAPYEQEYGAAAWAGYGAPRTPGSITWAMKTLNGVTPKTLTTTQKNNLEADNINHYQTRAGINITRPGKVVSGEWIDVIHGIDALTARIEEDVFGLLANSQKVPFTEAGLDLVASTILAAIAAFEGSADQPGLIARGSARVIMPTLDSISASDKAARRLTGVRFSATLEGAIHYVSIVGTLSN